MSASGNPTQSALPGRYSVFGVYAFCFKFISAD